jgi:CBS domain-containing protein
MEPGQGLETALNELTRHGGVGLPVIDEQGALTAWITHRDVLRAAAGIASTEAAAKAA